MLDEGRIKGFEQYSNPGAYELQWTDQSVANRFPVLNSLPTPAEFYRQIEASISLVEPLRPLLTKHATTADEPALLQVLQRRAQTVFPPQSRLRDALSDAACDQIVSLHNLDALADALAVTTNRILTSALQNAPSRDFLLRVIGSPAQPYARRLGCAKAAYAAFSWWDIPSDGDYLPRLLSLCKSVQDTPDLTATLLNQIDALALFDHSDAPPAQAYPVIKSSLPTLRQVYKSSSNGAVRFTVEQLFLDTVGYSTYQSLKSPCGPILSLTQPANTPPGDPPPTAHTLTCSALIRQADSPKHNADGSETTTYPTDAEITSALVLVIRNKKRYMHLPSRETDWQSSNGGERLTIQADLPLDLPHGRYHVFLEFTRPHQPVSTGYGYDVNL